MNITNLLRSQQVAIRFVIVGGLSFALDYGLLLFTYDTLGLPTAVATTGGFLAGLFVNFLLNKYWTFNAPRGARHSARQAVLYGILVVINLAITNLIVLCFDHFRTGPEISKPIASGVIFVINYIAYKQIIFKNEEPDIELV